MSAEERQAVIVRDLAEEAKKRILLLAVCVIGLSYLMSLTSASVIVNLPAALFLILLLRYMSLDFEMRRRALAYKGTQKMIGMSERSDLQGLKTLERPDWKHKVNSPVVADAIEQFTRHIVSEWVTDLWYSRITTDKQGPEELVLIMNGVLGEISSRMRHINLISLLTRDTIKILCSNLDLFRVSKKLVEKHHAKTLSVEEQDLKLKSVLAAENKLHPFLFSPEAEHKVLQQVVEGLVFLTFQPEDFHCSSFRYISRELLSCAVLRPVLNLANPRFVNERIESAVISAEKSNKAKFADPTASLQNVNESPRTSDPDPQFVDPSFKGVELVHFKKDQDKNFPNNLSFDDLSGTILSKDPLLSMDTRTTRSWSSLPDGSSTEVNGSRQEPIGEWGDVLDAFSHRKTEALAPEHFDNLWSKGRNYKFKEDTSASHRATMTNSLSVPNQENQAKFHSKQGNSSVSSLTSGTKDGNGSQHHRDQGIANISVKEDESVSSDEVDSYSSSYTEDDDPNNVMRLDSPGVKVWDGKNKRNFSNIHHPLENFERNKTRRKDHLHSKGQQRTKFSRKRSRSSIRNRQVWQEGESTSILLGDGQDALTISKESKFVVSSDDSEPELVNSSYFESTSASTPLAFVPEGHQVIRNAVQNSVSAESFFKLRCEVVGADIVKCGAKTFAVYKISVTDVNSRSWSIKRRYQHFEELHRRLKLFPEYNLHLPPKHFLSTGLGVDVIQERCKLLDQYLKNLFQLPNVSSSIEVWDFLSVDSQMYIFSDSLYIIQTLQVENAGVKANSSTSRRSLNDMIQTSAPRIKDDYVNGRAGLRENFNGSSIPKNSEGQSKRASQDMNGASEDQRTVTSSKRESVIFNRDHQESHPEAANDASDPTVPSEWVPPNLSAPILDLVDVILQLKDGGWIRRKAFWAAKQVLQLGMGDAFDDWLIEKIQVLRKGSVIASGIRRLEMILWPDGIFITKRSNRRLSPGNSTGNSSTGPLSSADPSPRGEDSLDMEVIQKREAERRAKFVYETMIDNAPGVIVSLVGRREYENCARDLYFFIQSSVFLKKLAFELLELVVLSAFPELDHVFKQFEHEKDKFGVPILSKDS